MQRGIRARNGSADLERLRRPGTAPKSEESKDAGVKAYVNTPNPEDAGIRRFAGAAPKRPARG